MQGSDAVDDANALEGLSALEVLRDFHPLGPRMWMDLSTKPYDWANGVGVNIPPPVPGSDVRTQYWDWWEQYMACPWREDGQAFHSWL